MPDDFNGTELMEDGLSSGTQAVGAGLRAMRERLGWKLPEVAANLNIRQEFLEAIEAGDLQALPGPAYRTGFVRSYASKLGLDPDEILRRFRAEGGLQDTAKTETRFIANVPDSGVPKGATVLLGVVLILAGYGIWYHYSDNQRRLAEQVPAVPAELAPLATPPKMPVAPVTPAAAPAPGAVASTAMAVPAPQPASTAPGAGMVISATQDAWVEVQDPTGNILFSKVLHPGDSWPVPQESGLTLTTGNAGGTVIVNNGVAGSPLGAPAAVLHDYQLTPAAAPAVPPAPAQPVTPQAASGGSESQPATSGTQSRTTP
jgi:cytoskeleton protein RodZ